MATKPGISCLRRTGVFPRDSTKETIRSTVSGAVPEWGTTSTQAITSAGLKKWRLHTLSGRAVASATREETMLDEFVTSSVWSGQTASSSEKIVRLTERSSTAASITRSAVAAAASRSVVRVSRSHAASTSSRVRRSFSTSRERRCSSCVRARSSWSWLMSTREVPYPARAQTAAIWDPMVPAPRTTTVRISVVMGAP